jgi:TLC ATP/ADP transporter
VVEHWTYSLFFCIAELWGSVVISVLFWTLANDVCTVADAKTIYPLMGIAANIALVVAGNFMKYVNRSLTQVGPDVGLLPGSGDSLPSKALGRFGTAAHSLEVPARQHLAEASQSC